MSAALEVLQAAVCRALAADKPPRGCGFYRAVMRENGGIGPSRADHFWRSAVQEAGAHDPVPLKSVVRKALLSLYKKLYIA